MYALATRDPEVARIIAAERARLTDELVLIASENYASSAVIEAVGSVMTDKYAEGYPGRRYYGGCENMDAIESLAVDRAKRLFGADHANVQPHSGSQANMAAYFALLQPGDRVLGMRLDQGGHLTHGSKVNFSGKIYEFGHYGVDRESERIDYDNVARIARDFKPKVIVAGATAYPRTIDFPRFRKISDEVGALLVVDMAHIAGLVAGGAHPSPVPHAAVVTSTAHKTLRSARGGFILCKAEYARKIDSAVFPNTQGGPLMHAIAGKAVGFGEALKPEFAVYARNIVANARALAAALAGGGLRIVSGGTDNHLLLVDVRPLKMTGKQADEALNAAGIVVNKNAIPYDPEPPAVTSGVRLGTPSLTTRGMTPVDMGTVAGFILESLRAAGSPEALRAIKGRVATFARAFPAPGVTGDA